MHLPSILPSCLSLALLTLTLSAASNASKAQANPTNQSSDYQIEAIDVQIYDRTTQQLVPLSELRPDPYGFDMDLLVSVTVRHLQQDPDAAFQTFPNLTLTVSAPGYDYPATGPVPPWQESHTRPLDFASGRPVNSFPFLVEYQCYFDVELTATLPQTTFSKTIELGCAE